MRSPSRHPVLSEAMREVWDNPDYRARQTAHLRKIAPKSLEKRRQNTLARGLIPISRGTPEEREYKRIYKIAVRIIEKARRVRAMKQGAGVA